MGKTSIEWTDASWNPVTGCREISPGCANCYAARLAATRLKNTAPYKGLAVLNGKCQVTEQSARWTGKVRMLPQRLAEPICWRKPRRIFVCDMSDLFHEDVPTEFIAEVWAIMARCHRHTFQVLTKRTGRMRRILSSVGSWEGWITLTGKPPKGYGGDGIIMGSAEHWPLPNVWIGTSVENQTFADARIPELLQTPAAVRFISAEPLLGVIDLEWVGVTPHRKSAIGCRPCNWKQQNATVQSGRHTCCEKLPKLDWVIAGGESGYNARPMHPAWLRSLRDQCVSAGVPFFFKQWGEYSFDDAKYFRKLSSSRIKCCDEEATLAYRVGKGKAGRLLDDKEWNEFPETKG